MEARPGERGSTTKLRIKGHKRWDEDSSDGGPDTRQTQGWKEGRVRETFSGGGEREREEERRTWHGDATSLENLFLDLSSLTRVFPGGYSF